MTTRQPPTRLPAATDSDSDSTSDHGHELPTTPGAEPRNRVGRRDLWLAITVLAVLVAGSLLSIGPLADPDGPGRLLAGLYDGVGLDGQADALRTRGLQPVPSALITLGWALALGSIGIWYLFWALNTLVDTVPGRWRESVRPYVYILPACALLGFYLLYPVVATVYFSFTLDDGFGNYATVLGDPDTQRALINNLIWLVVATGGSVLLGLVIAQLFDRIKRESLAKTFVFMPLALSMVGAAVIWRFMYIWRPPGQDQIGVINAAVTSVGVEPIPILNEVPLNTFALIAIMVWLQTGFAMVILSAAIKGVPSELLEAARIDGANELQVFLRIIVPSIRPSIITVATTIGVAVLKVFDIVFVMTGGRFETEVIANQMFTQMFKFRSFGLASATAVLLFVLVLPAMILNLRNFRSQELTR